jgi:hypothetical protein
MREKVQCLVMRAHGMNGDFSLADPTRERFPVTPAPSRPDSPSAGTPNASRPSSPTRTEESPDASPIGLQPVGVCSYAEVDQQRGRTSMNRPVLMLILSPTIRPHFHETLFRRHHTCPYSRVSTITTISVNTLSGCSNPSGISTSSHTCLRTN